MSIDADVLAALAAAGATAEMIVAAVRVAQAKDNERAAEKRRRDADRKRRSRSMSRDVTRTSCDIDGHNVTSRDVAPLDGPPSPEPLPPLNPPNLASLGVCTAPAQPENAPQPKRASPRKPDNAEHDRFAEFWAKYPRHEGRKPAAKAFATAAAKHDTERIFAGLDRWLAANAGKDPQYLPHAATWLNQERWTDEPSISNRPQPGRPDRHERRGPIANPMAAAAIESLGRSGAGGWPFDADGPDVGGYGEADRYGDCQSGPVIIDAMPLFDGRSSVPPNVGYADGGGNRYRR